MTKQKIILRKYINFEENNYWRCKLCKHKSNGHLNRVIAHLTCIPGKGIKVCPEISPEKAEELKRELGLGPHSTNVDGQQLHQPGGKNNIRQEKGNKKKKCALGSEPSGSDPSGAEMPPVVALHSTAPCESIILNIPPPGFPSSQSWITMAKQKIILGKYVIFEEHNYWRCRSCQHKSNGHPNRIIAHLTRFPGKGIKLCEKISTEKMEELKRELGLGPTYPSPFPRRSKRPCPSGLPSFHAFGDSDMGITSHLMWLQGGVVDQGIQSLNFQEFGVTPWTQRNGASQCPNVNISNSVITSFSLFPKQSAVDVHLPFEASPCVIIKVHKSGPFVRSLHISKFTSCVKLHSELARMFGFEGQLEVLQRSGQILVIVDQMNNLLIWDDPWQEFINEVSLIKPLSLKFQYMDEEEISVTISVSERNTWNSQNLEMVGATSLQLDNSEQNSPFSVSDLISSPLETWDASLMIPPENCTLLRHDQEDAYVPNTNNDGFQDTNAMGSKLTNTIHKGKSSQIDSTQVSFPQGGMDLGVGDPTAPPPHVNFNHMNDQHMHPLQDGVQFHTSSLENAFGVEMAMRHGLADPPPCPPGFDSDLMEFYLGTDIWSPCWDYENFEIYN